ncbi:hypothetical protein ACWIG5_09930 [Streptomyces lydicus]
MITPLHNHVRPTPPALSEAEWATARWEDDGGPTPVPRPNARSRHWLRIAAALSERLPELADREDVIVTCEHGTRSGAPAAFTPPQRPWKSTPPSSPHWTPPPSTPCAPATRTAIQWPGAPSYTKPHMPPPLRGTALGTAAQLLEESRAEHAHLHRRPDDRRFLRVTVHTLVLQDFTTETPTDRWQAVMAAALILARRDAGILDPDETEPLENTITSILGPGPGRRTHRRTGRGDRQGCPPGTGERGRSGRSRGRVAAARSARAQAKAAQAAHTQQAAKTAEKVLPRAGRTSPANPPRAAAAPR